LTNVEDVLKRMPEYWLLMLMHSICAVRPEVARTAEELAGSVAMTIDHVHSTLSELCRGGYVTTVKDERGSPRYYVTGLGIIKVCSLFT